MKSARSLSKIVDEAVEALQEVALWPDRKDRNDNCANAIADLRAAIRGYDKAVICALVIKVASDFYFDARIGGRENLPGFKKAWAMIADIV